MKHVVAALALIGCQARFDGVVDGDCPPLAGFTVVSPMLEQRCGTLDCHGAVSRPLRVYGAYGLRHAGSVDDYGNPARAAADGAYPAGLPTTAIERAATRRALCGLEPERMAEVRRGEIDARDLMVLRKPTADPSGRRETVEGHKGGAIFARDSPAEICLRSWLEGAAGDAAACHLAVSP